MKNVIVITGGGSGMGLDTARLVGKEPNTKVIISGRTVAKLEGAIRELAELGIDAEAYPCDVSDRSSVEKLTRYAAGQGAVNIVIHAAGVSPHMAGAEKIFAINAAGPSMGERNSPKSCPGAGVSSMCPPCRAT